MSKFNKIANQYHREVENKRSKELEDHFNKLLEKLEADILHAANMGMYRYLAYCPFAQKHWWHNRPTDPTILRRIQTIENKASNLGLKTEIKVRRVCGEFGLYRDFEVYVTWNE